MQDLPNTRQSLIVRLKKSSDDAWSEVLSVYEDAIVRFCRSRGLQDADARDVTQEVFAALHGKIDQWSAESSRGSFRGWLFRVARNIVVDRIRERTRRPTTAGDNVFADATKPEEPAASAFLFEYRRSLFSWAAAQVRNEIQETTWQCFYGTAIEERKPTDVASEFDVSVGTVYTAKCRVVARIREKIEQLSGVFDDESFNNIASASGLFARSEVEPSTTKEE